ncbi:hypothetical protein M2281_002491 [Mesorhizobium soli]|uniref:hypothetical protein n=1 Tax=Pseudaminobacter soli (ex Li et al. 2025) TaxID=1295366 RepID=UPI0024753608|nr:hypothetical protein [Mesorhizobium soli]MDH6231893.1 hypothetical protein [Mesorhizobium soli]
MTATKLVVPVSVSLDRHGAPVLARLCPLDFDPLRPADLEDEIDIIGWLVRHPFATFWWRVSGIICSTKASAMAT